MKSLFRAGAAFLVLTLAACGGGGGNNGTASFAPPNGPVANVAAPNGGDWTQTVSQTERGFLMGNPNAPVKLVEYASITCPHCAEFTVDGGAEGIQTYVRSGRVSWEYRPYAIFPTDPGLFALLRCQGAGAFFPLAEQLYADQSNWAVRGQTYLTANRATFEPLSDQAKAATLVRETGVDAFFRQRGMTQPQIDQCLASLPNIQRATVDTQHAVETDNPPGTPTFYINGAIQDGVGLWSALEPRLRQAVGG
jgi:protein-disulfide isomerase